MRNFSQVDVFSSEPLARQPGRGRARRRRDHRRADGGLRAVDEPVGDDVPADARPTDEADYRLRIFTPGRRAAVRRAPDDRQRRTRGWRPGECRAPRARWCRSAAPGWCGCGEATRLAFAAPPFIRSGAVVARRTASGSSGRCGSTRRRSSTSSGSTTARAGSACCWTRAEEVLALEPDWSAFGGMDIGVVGPYAGGQRVRGGDPRLLPGLRDRRGPGDRQPQRRGRPVAGRRPAARRRTSPRRAPPSAGAGGCYVDAGGRHGLGGW